MDPAMTGKEESLFGHSVNPLYKPVDASGKDVVLEPIDVFTEDELRKRVASVLLTFPESNALCCRKEFEEAIETILKESRPETASLATPGMVRLADDDISLFLVMSDTPTVDELPGVGSGGVFPPGWLYDRRKELEKECQRENKKIGQRYVLGDKVRVDLITKGFVEIHEDYMEEDPDFDPYEGRVLGDFSNVVFAPDDFEGEVMILPPPDGYQEEVD